MLGGCGGMDGRVTDLKQSVRRDVAALADQTLDSAEYLLCDASRGAVLRRYGRAPEVMQAWWVYCEALLSHGPSAPRGD